MYSQSRVQTLDEAISILLRINTLEEDISTSILRPSMNRL